MRLVPNRQSCLFSSPVKLKLWKKIPGGGHRNAVRWIVWLTFCADIHLCAVTHAQIACVYGNMLKCFMHDSSL